MKKIVFCLQTMVLGGVEKELITILKKLNNEYDITLLLLYLEDTEILNEIPNNINIVILNIDKNYFCTSTLGLVFSRLKRGKLIEAFSIALKWLIKLGISTSNTNIGDIPELKESYDVAVCYHIHSPLMLKYVVNKIDGTRKIGWIHNDFDTTGYPIQRLKKYINDYDEFIAVSRKVENEFRKHCPWYNGNICTEHNYLDEDEIKQRSLEKIEDEKFYKDDKIRLITIGRFTEQKGIDLAIKTAALLKSKKLNFNWFLIGYGELEDVYRQLIQKYDVGDCFIILGKKTNPYPYIRECNICVQPSRHEAYPLVLMEAKILEKPIVCTNFDGADELIDNRKNGIIVPIGDVLSLSKEVELLIRYSEEREALANELKNNTDKDGLYRIKAHFDIP